MKFAIIIAAALLGASPALAGKRAFCPGANAGAVEKGCSEAPVPLVPGATGTCCASTAADYCNMAKICFTLGSTPIFELSC
ncbi:hypothetical protein P3342_001003 [Pyrenophora teres f. teres]|nr:hypothetical protein HRS9122_06069 [Pyrenophora teres f. teres]KAE8868823.1 hypothetical protein PTNB73_03876 [Pyrenophora teres f. teres]KAK1918283.1 hypothetical protein P3342_001003 [Pyrenophora teres f. teres]